MTAGVELLEWARGAAPEQLSAEMRFGAADAEAKRAALVAVLLSSRTDSDFPLIRALTRWEIEFVRELDDGCGNTLYACCWLLFSSGDVADVALIWEAKMLNFDAGCTIDSAFLMPEGIDATVQYAESVGLGKLASWVRESEYDQEEIDALRDSSYFGAVPPATAPQEELAAWLRS